MTEIDEHDTLHLLVPQSLKKEYSSLFKDFPPHDTKEICKMARVGK